MTDAMEQLRSFLENLPGGPIAGDAKAGVITGLVQGWGELSGSDEEAMRDDKLERVEDLAWNPPILDFWIERHGGTVLGSTRAALHHWVVNVMDSTASIVDRRFRQVKPPQKRMNLRPVAQEIAESIQQGMPHARLKWVGGEVRVLIGDVLPEGSAAAATLASRRKRFRAAVLQDLDGGWSEIRPNVYRRERSAASS